MIGGVRVYEGTCLNKEFQKCEPSEVGQKSSRSFLSSDRLLPISKLALPFMSAFNHVLMRHMKPYSLLDYYYMDIIIMKCAYVSNVQYIK